MRTRPLALSFHLALVELTLACSPVVLPEETETDAGTGTGGGTAGETGASETGAAEDGTPEPSDVPTACVDLEPRVLSVFEANCAKCHGAGSVAQGGMDYILNLDALIANDKVEPGKPNDSRVYVRMAAMEAPMPPLTEMQRPSSSDIQSVHDWIANCAGVQSCGEQPFMTRDVMLQKINADLSAVPLQNQKFTRYFSFVHLYNAGWCDGEIEVFRQALIKLVNSLSQETLIKAPVAIDPEKLIYRVDISDYDWDRDDGEPKPRLSEPTFYFRDENFDQNNEDELEELAKEFNDKWEMMADQNPYNIEYIGQTALNIKTLTGTHFTVVQGDSFIDVASRSPLYYDILGIPTRSARLREQDPECQPGECLEDLLNIDILLNIQDEKDNDDGKVARAGFHDSDVSDFNRVIERHRFNDANNRVFWLSYDFAGQSGLQNIGVHPLDFDFDGGEIIFNLPNGLQAYMLTNAAGGRLNEGPINIVQDESQKDFLVRNGVSCMGCHSSGMIKRQDDLRYALDNGQAETQFTDLDKELIRALYPLREEFDDLLEQDTRRFNDALSAAGVTPDSEKEPVITSFLSFDEDVNLRRAAAELGLREEDLGKDIGQLNPDLDELSKEGGTILRKDFTANFAASACVEFVGCSRECPAIPNPNGTGQNEFDTVCDLTKFD
ncbi:MAG: hypothetical protein JNL82_41715 [Myxococcales bacterium]|nr:hypothetical protein [Myxococcales bacterium]